MKRKLLPIIAILLVILLAGCAAFTSEGNKQSAKNNAQSGEQTAQTQPAAEKTTKAADEVKKIAFDHANVKEADVTELEVELDNDGGVLHFDISFDAGEYDYDYEIDAYTGKILKDQKEKETSTPPATTAPAETKPATTTTTTTTTKTKKSESAVKKIAFNHAGVKEANVNKLEISLDKDDGALHYDISFESGSYDYDYDIDAYSGKILKSEKEKDSDNKKPASTTKPTTTTTTKKTKKTVAQVKKIALNHAGVKESATRDLEIELDKEGGKEIYEITFESGNYDYEYEIDAYSGKILHSEKDRDD